MSAQDKEIRIGVDKPNNHIIYGLSLISVVLSLITVRKNPPLASFFGLWAPTILGLGAIFKENQLLERTRGLTTT
jgi:hypothetical protein